MNLIPRIYTYCLRLALLSSVVGLFSVLYLEANLPSIDALKDVQLQVPLKVYSQDNKLIAEFGNKRRNPVTLNEIPQDLINAIIATEDSRFFQHNGVDLRSIARATVALITLGHKSQGGSTITMQVARNFFLTRKKTYTRKINEILLAYKIEQELTKGEILELYFNKIFLGNRAYGIGAAAKVYYGTEIKDLTLPQMAMLAGLPQAPSAINPLANPTAAKKRRNTVLDRMLSQNFISFEQYSDAIDAPLTAKYHPRKIELHAPYVAEMVRKELAQTFGNDVYSLGFEVYTTIDSKKQKYANAALERAILEYDSRHGYRGVIANNAQDISGYPNVHNLMPALVVSIDENSAEILLKSGDSGLLTLSSVEWTKKKSFADLFKPNDVIYVQAVKNNGYRLAQIPEIEGALTAMNPDTGAIVALVGGFNFQASNFNRATQANRQPGSTFKPFIYSAALSEGFTAASIINDAPIVQENPEDYDWRPQNHTKMFYGPTRLRTGIVKSRNLVSIRLLHELGVDRGIEISKRFGFTAEQLPKGLSLALGSGSVTPLELNTAYCTFPNGGYQVKSYFIEKITNYQNEVLFTANPITVPDAPRVISEQTAYLMTSMLEDVIKEGTGSRAKILKRTDLCGKSGTTNDQMDVWFSGYNRDLVVTTWMGFDDPKTIKEYATKTALTMWIYFMDKALKGMVNHSPQMPSGLTTVRIDPKTGLLAAANQKDSIYEIFVEGTAPTKQAPSVIPASPWGEKDAASGTDTTSEKEDESIIDSLF